MLILGASLADFMKTLGVYSSGGGREHTKLRNQMRRLFNAYVQLIYEDKLGEASVNRDRPPHRVLVERAQA